MYTFMVRMYELTGDPAFIQVTWLANDRSPDGLPYLGRSKRIENLTIATGHAMIGMSLGPITGKHVAEIVTGTPPPYDLAMLDPERYY